MEPDRGPNGEASGLTDVMHRNIETLLSIRREFEQRKRPSDRIADRVTGLVGSMRFVWFSAVLFGAWIVVNLGWVPGVRPFDPYPFVMLAMVASVEAIFLSTFILVSQNRMAELDKRQADLDLQVSLLAEHEVTRLIQLVDEIAKRLGADATRDPRLDELKRDVDPHQVIEELEHAERARD
jgi:uncharacterized membrane protein